MSCWVRTAVFLTLLGLGAACQPAAEEEPPPEPPVRRVLHEIFTGSNCGPCASADPRLLEVFEQAPDQVSFLSYQIGSDPYISYEAVQRRMHYVPEGESGYSIPYVHADGVNGFHPNLMNDEAGYTFEDFSVFAAEPSGLWLSVEHSVSDQTVDIEVRLEAVDDYPSEDLVLHQVIVENETTQNIGSNGQTEFHHVVKKMLPDQHGESIESLAAGATESISTSYTFAGDYLEGAGLGNLVDHSSNHTVEEFTDLSVVVWVQDAESDQVHQSAWSGGDEAH